MLNTQNKQQTQLTHMMDLLRNTPSYDQMPTLILDLAVICKALSKDDISLLVAETPADKLFSTLKAVLDNLNTDAMINYAFSIYVHVRREIIASLLENPSETPALAKTIQQSFLSLGKSSRLPYLGVPENLTHLMIDIASANANKNGRLLLCGSMSPEYALAATAKFSTTQIPTHNTPTLEIALKLLYLSEQPIDLLTEEQALIFQPETPFDGGILADTFGAKNYHPIWENKQLKRLAPELTQAQTMMRHVHGRIVCLIPLGRINATSGDDALFKESLLTSGLLEAVVQLPSRLLAATGIPIVLFIINTTGGFEKVNLIDASGESFYNDLNRTTRLLSNTQEITALLNGKPSPHRVSVPTQKILDEDTNLQVNRYLKTEARIAAEAILATYPLVSLQDIAEIKLCQMIRPAPDDTDGEDLILTQISQQNIDRLGQIDTTTAKPMRMTSEQERRIDSQRLQPGDILFSTKGIMHICALVEKNAEGMIPNQAFVIIRLKKDNTHFATAQGLFLYLRSTLCRVMLESLITGSAMKVIKTQDLKTLQIPIATQEEQQAQIAQYTALKEREAKRKQMEQAINQDLNHIWGLDQTKT